MKTNFLLCLAVMASQALLVTGRACPDQTHGQFSAADYKFAQDVAQDGLLEINLGNLAAVNSKTSAVQQFGLKMVFDHTQAGKDLSAIASHKGATLPTTLTARQQKQLDKLAAYAGPEFDKAYLKLMVRDHKADEKMLNHAPANIQDAELKAFAAGILPVVQEHLRAAENLDVTVKHELSFNH